MKAPADAAALRARIIKLRALAADRQGEPEGRAAAAKADALEASLAHLDSAARPDRSLAVAETRRVGGSKYAIRYVPAGRYLVGQTSGAGKGWDDELPVHEVTLSCGVWMGEVPVTQGLYASVVGENPAYFRKSGPSAPVETVSWYDAVRFANLLSAQEGLDCCYEVNGEVVAWIRDRNGYRLPTESEWEISARGGLNLPYAGSADAGAVAWFAQNSEGCTHPVGQKLANAYGLFDLSGNVREWCWDWMGTYPTKPTTDYAGPAMGRNRVDRGGSWDHSAVGVRLAYRSSYVPSGRSYYLGFRLARSADP